MCQYCTLIMDTMKRNITTEKAIKMLRKNGIELSEIKAGELLDFMYFLANFIVNQNFKK